MGGRAVRRGKGRFARATTSRAAPSARRGLREGHYVEGRAVGAEGGVARAATRQAASRRGLREGHCVEGRAVSAEGGEGFGGGVARP